MSIDRADRHRVARLAVDDLERAFQMTQTLDKAWGHVIQAMEDCEFLAAEDEIRSTSCGVILARYNRYYILHWTQTIEAQSRTGLLVVPMMEILDTIQREWPNGGGGVY